MTPKPVSLSSTIDTVMRRMTDCPVVVYDCETDGLDWRHNKIVGHVFTFGPAPQDSYYVPVRHGDGGNATQPLKFENAIAKIANVRQDIRWVFHNGAAFDLKFMFRVGVLPVGALEDTMINMSLINEYTSMSLDGCCKYFRVQGKKGDELYARLAAKYGGTADRNQMANFHRLPGNDPVAVDYACGDGTSTWQLWEEQQKELDLQQLRRVWATECELIPVLLRMMTRGIKVNEDRLHRIKDVCDDRYRDAKRRARLPDDFNDRSPMQMEKLFRDAGITNYPRTAPTKGKPDGQPSFTKAWLSQTPLGQSIVEAREYRHLVNSFLTPLIERHLWNGRVHTNYNQTRGEDFGVITGRMSSNDPNLQQVHKRNEKLGRMFRSIFVPDRDMVWGESDYSQIEPRLLAHYSGCRVLLDGYKAVPSVDAHGAVAKAIWGESYTKEQRQRGKTVNQTLISGGGKNKIIAELGLSERDGNQLWNDYFQAMPEIRELQKKSTRVYEQRGYVRSLDGRRARLDDPKFSYKAINRLLQCGNAAILKSAMVTIDGYLKSRGDETHLINNCHDALSFQFHPEHRDDYDEALRLMTAEGEKYDLVVPLEVDHDEGDDWSIATWGPEK